MSWPQNANLGLLTAGPGDGPWLTALTCDACKPSRPLPLWRQEPAPHTPQITGDNGLWGVCAEATFLGAIWRLRQTHFLEIAPFPWPNLAEVQDCLAEGLLDFPAFWMFPSHPALLLLLSMVVSWLPSLTEFLLHFLARNISPDTIHTCISAASLRTRPRQPNHPH